MARTATTSDDGDDEYRFLAGLIDKGMFEMAADEGTKFLRDHPRHEKAVLARYRLATALFELEEFQKATPHYEKLAQQGSFEYQAESTFRLGQCLLSLDRYGPAREAFLSTLRLKQDYLFAPATFLLGETAFRSGDSEEAEQRYQELLRLDADSEYVPAARRGLAWCAWNGKDVDATVERTQSYLARHGDEPEADEMRVLLGEALLEGDRPDEALAAFRTVTGREHGDARHRGSGYAYAAQGDHVRAAAEFAALIDETPDSRFAGEARLLQGIQTLRAGDAKGAVRLLKRAGSDSESLYWLAQAESEAGDPEGALSTLDRALTSKPDRDWGARIQVARGDLLSELGREDAALAAYEQGGSDYAMYAAAVAQLNGGDAEKAARLARRFIDSYPESTYAVQAQLVLGESQFELGRYEPAEEAFATVLGSHTETAHAARATTRIAWCRYLRGDLPGAAEGCEQVRARYSDQQEAEEALYMLARVRMEMDDKQSAFKLSETYARMFPQGRYLDEVLLMAGRAAPGDAGLGRLGLLVEQQPDSPLVPQALLELGDRLAADGRTDQAILRYEHLLTDHQDSEQAPQARYGLAWCLYGQERFEESARLLESVGRDDEASDELRLASWELCVWSYTKAGDPRAGAAAWRQFSRASTDDARRFDSVRAVVAAYRDAGRPGDGQALLDELLSSLRDPEVAIGVLVEGAYLALEGGDVDRADAQVQVARRRAPESTQVAEASFFVGEARFDSGNEERAIELYTASIQQASPMRANALYKLGFAELQRENLRAAEEAFGVLVDEYPASELWGESLFLLGETRFRQERYSEAVLAFQLLRREAPDHDVTPKALFRLGVALGHTESWEACEQTLALLARQHPEFENLAEAELWRGRALAARGNRRPARQAFERVVALDRGELAAQARLGIGRLLEGEDRFDEALSEYLKVAVLYGHEGPVSEALYRAGACLETLGDAEKARRQYTEVIEEHPDSRFAKPARERLSALPGGDRD